MSIGVSLPDCLRHSPVRVVFGEGTLAKLGALAIDEGATRVLLVTDPGIVRAGHVQRALDSLREAGAEVTLFDGVCENPTTREVEAGLHIARELAIDFIVGLGGGSSMDCAKGINFLLTNGGRMHDYWGVGKATQPMRPMICIPTTAGTGSEAQSFALITDPDTHQKMACGDKKALARVAILDPELIATVPPGVAAATGIDAVAHAIETAGCRKRTAISRELSVAAWRLLNGAFAWEQTEGPRGRGAEGSSGQGDLETGKNGPDGAGAFEDAGTLNSGTLNSGGEAARTPSPSKGEGWGEGDRPRTDAETSESTLARVRASMLLGAHLAGAAIEASMLGAAHACANPLTARFDITHGIAVGLMLPHVIRFNAETGENPYADLCDGNPTDGSTGDRIANAEALAQRVESMLATNGLPRRLRDIGIPVESLGSLAQMAADQWTAQFNPRKVDSEALLDTYQAAYD